jgi:hypothetical protein
MMLLLTSPSPWCNVKIENKFYWKIVVATKSPPTSIHSALSLRNFCSSEGHTQQHRDSGASLMRFAKQSFARCKIIRLFCKLSLKEGATDNMRRSKAFLLSNTPILASSVWHSEISLSRVWFFMWQRLSRKPCMKRDRLAAP